MGARERGVVVDPVIVAERVGEIIEERDEVIDPAIMEALE